MLDCKGYEEAEITEQTCQVCGKRVVSMHGKWILGQMTAAVMTVMTVIIMNEIVKNNLKVGSNNGYWCIKKQL